MPTTPNHPAARDQIQALHDRFCDATNDRAMELQDASYRLGLERGRREQSEAARQAYAAFQALANSFQVTGPDDDGNVWLKIKGQALDGAFCLGKPDRLAVMTAQHLEQLRQAALTAAGVTP